ncbi:oxidoreductase [Serendipita vermifera]|nr:oxidoreductase [Serendipita vermifera]
MSATLPKMQYVRLGNSGLKVSKLILGCMTYGNETWGEWIIKDEEVVFQHIKAAYEAGINSFDTAPVYSRGASERLLGKAIKRLGVDRSSLVIMTKIQTGPISEGYSREDAKHPDSHGPWLSRKHIFDSIKASLDRLQLDYVDLLQCHVVDFDTPIEETMQALHDVVKAGYTRYIGMSNCPAWQFQRMQNYAITNRLTPFISMQNYHCLLYREAEREMLPTCKFLGVGTIPWSPLGRGLLCRPRANRSETVRGKSDVWTGMLQSEDDPTNAIIDRVEEVAKKTGASMSHVALSWLWTKEPVAAPIVGTSSVDHLHDLIKSLDFKLEQEDIKRLEELYTARPVAILY